MLSRYFLTTCLAVLALLGFIGSLARVEAQQSLLNFNYDADARTRIEVVGIFGGRASRGFMPVRVMIRNGGIQDRNWNLNFDFGGSFSPMNYNSSFGISVPAGAELVHELVVPVPSPVHSGSMHRNQTVVATSPGLKTARRSDSMGFNIDWPAIGLSEKLAVPNANALDTALKARGSWGETFGDQFSPATLPADWRGYTSLDVLMLTDEEWRSVVPGARLAIIEWVRLGGRLDIYTTSQPERALPSLDLPDDSVAGTQRSLSLGEVRAWKWNGRDLDVEDMINRYKDIDNRAAYLSEDYKTGWDLFQSFGGKSFNPWLVILLLIAFGILVGPVNLFVWAKPGQRHRMFFTTPIIALGASFLILVLILRKDGVGGVGRRIILANLQSEAQEKRLYITQEQISRTGVLIGSGFKIQDPIFLSPVMMPASEWNRLTLSGDTVASFSLNDRTYRGDWFQSRSEQGHFIQSVRPTRSRVELTEAPAEPDVRPKLFSSIEFTVDEFFYRDDQGQVWKAREGQVAGGEEIVLTKAESNELRDWWSVHLEGLSDKLSDRAGDVWERPGHFFAVSSDPNSGLVDTLGSIDWKKDKALVFGSVSAAVDLQAPEETEDQREESSGQ